MHQDFSITFPLKFFVYRITEYNKVKPVIRDHPEDQFEYVKRCGL